MEAAVAAAVAAATAVAAAASAASAATAVVAAAAAVGLTLALAKVAERKRSTGKENRLAKQHVAPKDKRGRWAGINSTTEGRETRSPEILSPCGAAALNERGSDDPLLSG